MVELSWSGSREVKLENGGVRKFIEDGDEVIMTACCKVRRRKICDHYRFQLLYSGYSCWSSANMRIPWMCFFRIYKQDNYTMPISPVNALMQYCTGPEVHQTLSTMHNIESNFPTPNMLEKFYYFSNLILCIMPSVLILLTCIASVLQGDGYCIGFGPCSGKILPPRPEQQHELEAVTITTRCYIADDSGRVDQRVSKRH